MKILLLSVNFAPEPISTGYYSGVLAAWLAARGHEVTVVAAPPYYPDWELSPDYRNRFQTEVMDGVTVVRCPLYVPAEPTGIRRIASLFTFALASLYPALRESARQRPELIISVAPSFMYAPHALLAAKCFGARSWLHVQDLEVDAAVSTGLLPAKGLLGRLAYAVEGALLRRFDRVSTISEAMAERIRSKGAPSERLVEFRNWSDTGAVTPEELGTHLREELGIGDRHVILYSGNIANKQGIEIIPEAARLLIERDDLLFLICGEGPAKKMLEASSERLSNVRFLPLQPRGRLPELLGMASVHLLPQIPGAADLVLPSKLANMLASGRPIVATAAASTGLAKEVLGAGEAVEPGNARAVADAVLRLVDDPEARRRFGDVARKRAESRWAREAILRRFEADLLALIAH